MKQRIITGVVIAAVFLSLLQWSGVGFAALIMSLAIIGYYEYLRMIKVDITNTVGLLGLAGIVFFVYPWYRMDKLSFDVLNVSTIWLLLFIFLALTVLTKNKVNLKTATLVFAGVIYIGVGFHYMAYTRLEFGLFWSYLLFSCIWITDIGAYFTGWAIGKRKLWPAISPNKTIEGALGGIVFSIIVAMIFAWIAPDQLSIGKAIALGLAISIVGQMGDLIQSAYKRTYGIKDSGRIFPGHGGVLDRTDSWLMVFPFVHLLSLI